MRQLRRQKGQAALLVTLSLPLVLGVLALAADVGWAYYRREAAQSAADAAAIAAAHAAAVTSPSGYQCSQNKVWCGGPSPCPSTAPASINTNFDNGCALAAQNGFLTTGSQRVTIQANTTSPAPTGDGIAAAYWVTARVSESALTLFGSLIGGPLVPAARATAALVQTSSGGGCLYVLNPHAQDAFSAGNGAQITAGCGIYVNSDGKAVSPAKEAMHITGGAKVSVTAQSINVVGSELEDNGGSHTGILNQNTGKAVADPLGSLPTPSPGNCLPASAGNMTAWKSTPYTPSAGTYCNGFTLSNGNSAVMGPGIYIINGGTFSIQSGPLTASGGVMIFLTNGATVNIANGTSVTLSAQSSGAYQGILFYSDRNYTPAGSNVAGGATMNLSGSLYFPTSTLTIDNGTNSTGTKMAIVADKVNFQGGAKLQAATSIADTGISPGNGYSLVTIE
jgi:Tfp pilus assembly protein PilX